jgi:hypothetical protein
MNSFQKWAQAYASKFGFRVTAHYNWVDLHKEGKTIELMSVQGVRAACELEREIA